MSEDKEVEIHHILIRKAVFKVLNKSNEITLTGFFEHNGSYPEFHGTASQLKEQTIKDFLAVGDIKDSRCVLEVFCFVIEGDLDEDTGEMDINNDIVCADNLSYRYQEYYDAKVHNLKDKVINKGQNQQTEDDPLFGETSFGWLINA